MHTATVNPTVSLRCGFKRETNIFFIINLRCITYFYNLIKYVCLCNILNDIHIRDALYIGIILVICVLIFNV